jgi:hypothetical protein
MAGLEGEADCLEGEAEIDSLLVGCSKLGSTDGSEDGEGFKEGITVGGTKGSGHEVGSNVRGALLAPLSRSLPLCFSAPFAQNNLARGFQKLILTHSPILRFFITSTYFPFVAFQESRATYVMRNIRNVHC